MTDQNEFSRLYDIDLPLEGKVSGGINTYKTQLQKGNYISHETTNPLVVTVDWFVEDESVMKQMQELASGEINIVQLNVLGFDELVHIQNIRGKEIGGRVSQWQIQGEFNLVGMKWHWMVDGEEIFDGPGLVFVGNISRYAVGLQILHYADYSDGLLDICIYKCASQLHLAKHSLMTILKHHAKRGDVIYRQGKNISVSSSSTRIKTEIDGDPGPALPVQISVIQHAVNCIVPEGAKPAGIRTRIIRAIG